MNVIVDGAHVVGIAAHDRFQCGNDLRRSFRRRAIGVMQLPWVDVHARFGKQSCSVEVVGIFSAELPHGIAVREIERLQVFAVRIADVSLGKRLDVRALLRRRFHLECFLDRLVGLDLARLVHRHVVIGADREGDSPLRHRQVRIKLRSFGKCFLRLGVIEGVDQAQPFVEIFLRERIGSAHHVMGIAHSGQ